MIARLANGRTAAMASTEVASVSAILATSRGEQNSGNTLIVVPMREQVLGMIGPALPILQVFSGLVLLIACANLANLMLGRATAARADTAMRLALGAQLSDVLRLVLGHGLKLTLIGAGLGLFGAYLVTRAITSVLYGVSATDPITFGFVSLLLIGVALVACYVPARRATKVEPLTALRNE